MVHIQVNMLMGTKSSRKEKMAKRKIIIMGNSVNQYKNVL